MSSLPSGQDRYSDRCAGSAPSHQEAHRKGKAAVFVRAFSFIATPRGVRQPPQCPGPEPEGATVPKFIPGRLGLIGAAMGEHGIP